MAPASIAEAISRPRPQVGLALLLAAAAMLGLYFAWPEDRLWWPATFYPLFWLAVVVTTLAGAAQVVWWLVPARWFRRLQEFSQHRVYLPLHIPREGVGYLVIMIVCFVGASMTHSNPLMLVFAAMAGPFVVNGSVTYAMLKNIHAARRVPPRAMAGELFSVELTMTNPSRWLSAWLLTVQDEVHHPQTALRASVLFTRLGRRSETSGHYQLQLPHRGRYRYGPLRVLSRYPLGLVERSRMFRVFDETLVYPRIGRLTPRWKRRLLGAAELVDVPQPRDGVFDDEFHHLREYRWGDNPRAIHWRSSARRNELIVREYQPNREHNLLVLVDLYAPEPAAPGDLERVEQALSFVATLCWEHRRECRGASLFVLMAGREVWRFEASTASAGLEALLDRLAVAAPSADNDFAHLMNWELVLTGPNTRSVVVSTRTGSQPPVGSSVQVFLTDPATLSEVLTYDDPHPSRHVAAAAAGA
jgi:uncharacterized protein (DUF58 family)